MSDTKMPAAERAEAHDRLVDTMKDAVRTLSDASNIITEGRDLRSSLRHGPAFSYPIEDVEANLSAARELLWKAHKVVAAMAYDLHREAQAVSS